MRSGTRNYAFAKVKNFLAFVPFVKLLPDDEINFYYNDLYSKRKLRYVEGASMHRLEIE